jgi:methionyl aminopeptidase
VQKTTEAAGYSVVRTLVGHGVGRQMHEDPQIPNFGEPGHGPVLQPGMTLAIEPMINAGAARRVPPRRRMVDLDGGRFALRALRAHCRGNRNGPTILTRRLEASLRVP